MGCKVRQVVATPSYMKGREISHALRKNYSEKLPDILSLWLTGCLGKVAGRSATIAYPSVSNMADGRGPALG